MSETLLIVKDLKTYFYTYEGIVRALEGVNFKINKNKIIGLVGETACGKSVTALSIMGLIHDPGKIIEGEIFFNGVNLLKNSKDEMRQIRGKKIAMIFQEPMTSINPMFTIGDQIAEIIMLHEKLGKKEAMGKALEMLKNVKMSDPEEVLKKYPHEMSGGMRQRAMIAMALSCSPQLLIADEPTTFLDVTVQAQILKLMKELAQEIGASVLMITHDMGVVAQMCDEINVMYAGLVIESAKTREIFHNPKHPYTTGLMKAVPRIVKTDVKLVSIPGTVPNLITPPSGCRFHPRCLQVMDICKEAVPNAVEVTPGHHVSCFLYSRRSDDV